MNNKKKIYELNRDRGNTSYYNFVIDKFGGTPIDEHRVKLDNDYFDGEVFIYENSNLRVLAYDYKARHDLTISFNPDNKFDYVIILFCEKVSYTHNQKKPLKLNVPTGFLILEKSEHIKFQRSKGDHIKRITIYLKKEVLSEFLVEKLNTIENFAFHKGDEHSALWKKIYYDKGPQNISDKFISKWKYVKLWELCIIVQNILYQFEEKDDKKIYMDSEFEAIFSIRDMINNNLQEKPVMTRLSKEYGINSGKLNEIFKYCFGQTIYKYYKHTRIYKVRDEIISTHKSLTEIAYEYGFSDINHLSKSFIEEFGEKPSDLKLSSKGKNKE